MFVANSHYPSAASCDSDLGLVLEPGFEPYHCKKQYTLSQ